MNHRSLHLQKIIIATALILLNLAPSIHAQDKNRVEVATSYKNYTDLDCIGRQETKFYGSTAVNSRFIGEQKCFYCCDLKQLSFSENYDDNGKQHGLRKGYFKSGRLRFVQNYNHGNKEGEYLSYYENGQLESKKNYRNDTEYVDGPALEFYENGKPKVIGTGVNGLKQGEWKYYNAEGQLIKVSNYVDGQEFGSTEYYNDGIIKSEQIFEGDKLKIIKYYSEDGKIALTQEFLSPQGKIKITRYSPSGFKIEETVKDSRQIYSILTYYETGQVKEQSRNDNDGTLTIDTFYENGAKKQAGILKNNLPQGSWLYYYPTGKIAREIIFEHGKLMEVPQYYDSKGGKLDVGTLKNGNGTFLEYDQNGVLLKTHNVVNGEIK